VADSLRLVGLDGGGFLLARCGVPFDATRSATACTAAFTSLAALHACGVVHGDARLANMVLLDGRAAWLDLAPGPPDGADAATFAVYCALDAETLAQSVLRAAGVLASPLPSAVTAALASYDAAAEHTVHALAAAVWAVAHPVG
jgi:tRNA A-37 threonylcarbamoyl transferase component Bud32